MRKINLTKEQEKQAIDLINQGISGKEFSEKFNLSHSTACRLIKKLIKDHNLNKDKYIKGQPNLKQFTQNEFDVLVGGLLGDSWIGFNKNSKNAVGSFTHKIEHSEYVEFKYNYLKRMCSEPTIHNKFDKRSNRKYKQSFCKIAANPSLNDIQKAFYKDGIKFINKDYINKLTALGIAIWFMDDGTCDKCRKTPRYLINVSCFSDEDIQLLIDMLDQNFKIKSKLESGKWKNIRILKESNNDFVNLVKPYICNCMQYKIN